VQIANKGGYNYSHLCDMSREQPVKWIRTPVLRARHQVGLRVKANDCMNAQYIGACSMGTEGLAGGER